METSKLISLKPPRNLKATIYSILVLILYVYTYSLMFKHSLESGSIPKYNDFDIFQILITTLWFLIIISIVWSYKIAKQTGRETSTWIIIGLFTGPIGLLIISLKDYKIKNHEILSTIKKTRLEYKQELEKTIKSENRQEYNREVEQKYNQLLITRTAEIITKEKVETLKELIDNGVIDKNTDLKEKERIIKFVELNKIEDSEIENWNPDWIENDNLCPACGNLLDMKSNNCLNCGLKIK